MEYQTVVVGGGCGGAGAGAGAGAGGDGKDDRNKRPFPKEGGRLNNVNHSPKLACPRCHSTNTKFCYFNNYSLSQPRHYCKSCKRFWTRGGTLRNNVPVGGKRRQSRRSCSRPQSVAVSATHRASRRRRQRPASLPPQPILVPRSTVVFRNNGNMRHFRRQNDVNSSSSLTPSIVLSNIMRNNELLRRFDAMSFYPATAGPVLGDSLNVGHDVPPLLPPQPGVDDDNNNHHEINNDEHNILEWVNNMGTGGFYEA